MHTTQIAAFTRMLAEGRDNALLRFGLGQALLADGQPAAAIEHLRAAVTHDPNYSAAYKLLGRALVEDGNRDAARDVFGTGIAVAEQRGDVQAAREMKVFLKRLDKLDASAPPPTGPPTTE
ncbi:tetratricopeptide repeat protein [Chitiniphilus eburneus]|uniref:Tetratricopeptide repeat protein n=1 Tax=Chitiniphilus eburneus TaxID=2571148 RepID=A0A4U0PWQ6_9NEIS|nr:tetratricopeptide repeat protein [Chitiniphilus eburneus]TJZ72996.1 tetratricopeptide repeat protein [Chitiniphilus eburneus]